MTEYHAIRSTSHHTANSRPRAAHGLLTPANHGNTNTCQVNRALGVFMARVDLHTIAPEPVADTSPTVPPSWARTPPAPSDGGHGGEGACGEEDRKAGTCPASNLFSDAAQQPPPAPSQQCAPVRRCGLLASSRRSAMVPFTSPTASVSRISKYLTNSSLEPHPRIPKPLHLLAPISPLPLEPLASHNLINSFAPHLTTPPKSSCIRSRGGPSSPCHPSYGSSVIWVAGAPYQ